MPDAFRLSGRRARWVHPATHEICKFMPHNPPERGQVVLVDGERHKVLRCPVRWDGRTWSMKRGVKVRAAVKPSLLPGLRGRDAA